MGSVLFEYVSSGNIASTGSTEMEGIGIGRITDNFKHSKLDGFVDDLTNYPLCPTYHTFTHPLIIIIIIMIIVVVVVVVVIDDDDDNNDLS